MIRSISTTAISLIFVASFALTARSAPTSSPQKVPLAASAVPKPAGSIAPKIPGPSAGVKGAIDKCAPDPRTGQMRCPGSGSTAPGPLGAACTTAAGVAGIWVVTSSASPMTCAPAGAACYTPTGGMGKVWASADRMVCGAKGDYCVNAKGDGKVFVVAGSVACLSVGDSCTCPAGTPGCKVVGSSSYMTFECAKRDVTCPVSSIGSLQMTPSNGTSNGTVQVSLKGAPRADVANVYCDYQMVTTAVVTSYSIPCHGAYANTIDGRWRACTTADNKVSHQVACDKPSPALISAKADAVMAALGTGVTPSSAVALTFKGSASDQAKEHAICNYDVNAFSFSVRVPCAAPRKASWGAYICN